MTGEKKMLLKQNIFIIVERVALAPSVKQTNVRLPALLLSSLSCLVKSQDPLSKVNVKILTLYQSQQIFKSPLHSL